jgi:hypothetical protein
MEHHAAQARCVRVCEYRGAGRRGVEGARLSPSDRLEYVEQESKGRYVFMAIDMDGSPEVVIEERLLKVSPVK